MPNKCVFNQSNVVKFIIPVKICYNMSVAAPILATGRGYINVGSVNTFCRGRYNYILYLQVA